MTPISPFKQTHARTHLCQHPSPPLSLPKALRHCERGCLPSSPCFMASACLSDNIRLSKISSHEGAVKLVTSAYHVLLSSHKLSPTLQVGVHRFSDSSLHCPFCALCIQDSTALLCYSSTRHNFSHNCHLAIRPCEGEIIDLVKEHCGTGE